MSLKDIRTDHIRPFLRPVEGASFNKLKPFVLCDASIHLSCYNGFILILSFYLLCFVFCVFCDLFCFSLCILVLFHNDHCHQVENLIVINKYRIVSYRMLRGTAAWIFMWVQYWFRVRSFLIFLSKLQLYTFLGTSKPWQIQPPLDTM
jgi:hypothetical protein